MLCFEPEQRKNNLRSTFGPPLVHLLSTTFCPPSIHHPPTFVLPLPSHRWSAPYWPSPVPSGRRRWSSSPVAGPARPWCSPWVGLACCRRSSLVLAAARPHLSSPVVAGARHCSPSLVTCRRRSSPLLTLDRRGRSPVVVATGRYVWSWSRGPCVTQVPSNAVVINDAASLQHEVDTLRDGPPVLPKGEVEPSLAEMEL